MPSNPSFFYTTLNDKWAPNGYVFRMCVFPIHKWNQEKRYGEKYMWKKKRQQLIKSDRQSLMFPKGPLLVSPFVKRTPILCIMRSSVLKETKIPAAQK